jgi:hypothetical protein
VCLLDSPVANPLGSLRVSLLLNLQVSHRQDRVGSQAVSLLCSLVLNHHQGRLLNLPRRQRDSQVTSLRVIQVVNQVHSPRRSRPRNLLRTRQVNLVRSPAVSPAVSPRVAHRCSRAHGPQ